MKVLSSKGLIQCFNILLFFFLLTSFSAPVIPVSYQGRVRPIDAYAKLWVYDVYHSRSFKQIHQAEFNVSTPLDFLWSLHFKGSDPFTSLPLFWVQSAQLKQRLKLSLHQNHFSYNDLAPYLSQASLFKDQRNIENEWQQLRSHVSLFKNFEGIPEQKDTSLTKMLKYLENRQLSPKQIAQQLEERYPLIDRLRSAGQLLKVLPGRYSSGEWFSLHALNVPVYDSLTKQLKLVGNFSLFSDQDFESIRHTYRQWQESILHPHSIEETNAHYHSLLVQLHHAYQNFLNHSHNSSYPTISQLTWESFYYRFPLIETAILLYLCATCLLILNFFQQTKLLSRLSLFMLILAFIFHTFILGLRCYILQRPPVSNMFETVIYVPWVTVLTSLLFSCIRPQKILLIAASLSSCILLIILQLTDLNSSLEHVQPVLNSQFWLIIHVLMIVGSYGIFLLGGVLGHFYLIHYLRHPQSTRQMPSITQLILQTLYLGTALLITGTILGGVWAAESWGRFWDWDPKESWAFISSCLYLIWIHAYRFNKIAAFGLAWGAVAGLLAISFTWYGVNYILGTGLHSYGFGSGGQLYYYGFLLVELAFLTYTLWIYKKWHLRTKNVQLGVL